MASQTSKLLVGVFTLLVLLTGCSKNVFQPEMITGNQKLTKEYERSVLMQHKMGITYKDGSFVTKEHAFINTLLPQGFAYINENNLNYIAADMNGTILLINKEAGSEQRIALKSRVLSASLKEDLLVTVDVKNSITVYDIKEDKTLYTFEGVETLAVDQRLANPYFYEELIFIPTLDGKVQFYSRKTHEIVREMSVSSEDDFNNIIFFYVNEKDNRLYVSTATKFYLFGKEKAEIVVPIRNVYVEDAEHFLLFTKDGIISRYDADLRLQTSLKLKFAHFLGVMKERDILVVEKEGYLLKVKDDLSSYEVYRLPFDEGDFFASKEGFFFQNGYYKP